MIESDASLPLSPGDIGADEDRPIQDYAPEIGAPEVRTREILALKPGQAEISAELEIAAWAAIPTATARSPSSERAWSSPWFGRIPAIELHDGAARRSCGVGVSDGFVRSSGNMSDHDHAATNLLSRWT